MTNSNSTKPVRAIGDIVAFSTEFSPNGARHLCGEVVGRDWCFDTLLAYTVQTLAGSRFHVNANTMEGGHPF